MDINSSSTGGMAIDEDTEGPNLEVQSKPIMNINDSSL